ncbi:MAG: hypothetical protein M1511_03395 [Deltaproteobacteria bacterium]|nr:hypothetical protein [Deltaproteobacteria bacterium]
MGSQIAPYYGEAVAPTTWGREQQGCVARTGNMSRIGKAGTTHANPTAGNSKSAASHTRYLRLLCSSCSCGCEQS